MSETHKQRGTLVPGTVLWPHEEDELERTLSIAQVMKRTGRSQSALKKRRRKLGVANRWMEASAI
jgi:hypothetical protein